VLGASHWPLRALRALHGHSPVRLAGARFSTSGAAARDERYLTSAMAPVLTKMGPGSRFPKLSVPPFGGGPRGEQHARFDRRFLRGVAPLPTFPQRGEELGAVDTASSGHDFWES
jgi:hypothetical protein